MNERESVAGAKGGEEIFVFEIIPTIKRSYIVVAQYEKMSGHIK
jgi:hypothetical protein